MLFGETAAVYCENNMEHINTLQGQNPELTNIKSGAMYRYHWVVTVRILLYYFS
jgi:hypothetical protein